jgi:hypothetical protein
MSIPYRDQDQLEDLGTAAFLCIEPSVDPLGLRGALFLINARGEPMEFTYNRVETPSTFLWRPMDIRRAAVRRLTASLLTMCPRVPRLILCRAVAVPAETFSEDLAVDVPVCRVAVSLEEVGREQREAAETTGDGAPVHLFWYPVPPAEDTAERLLIRELVLHGLLTEPFERASLGLDELYGAQEQAR